MLDFNESEEIPEFFCHDTIAAAMDEIQALSIKYTRKLNLKQGSAGRT
jgi:hypothetical protein